MKNEIERLVDYRKLHQGIIKELNRAPALNEGSPVVSPLHIEANADNVSTDLASRLARIERVGEILKQAGTHAREMEELVNNLQGRQMELETALEQATSRIAELEENLSTERNRATRAHAVANQATQRLRGHEKALADANARADALASAIDKALEGADASVEEVAAA
jgi:chromosome segregation ATPase